VVSIDLEKKREALVKAGLLDASTETLRADLEIAEEQRRVLSIYIDDVEQKLHVFDETAAKIDLFKKIISKLFKYKHLAIDRTRGFAFSTDENTPLSLTSLSSGEQNEVVLLASLLLNDQPASLFLIDEPEISLHVFWQKQFLRDLVDITSLLKIDVIIATHSPQIISDRWDLTIQLKGPDDPRPEL
jgi:predicted ATP-binding protein involved in virulence